MKIPPNDPIEDTLPRLSRSIWQFAVCATLAFSAAAAVAGEVWKLDRVDRIGPHAVKRIGAPRVVKDAGGKAVAFDGERDGMFLPVNPLAGCQSFTVEILFSSAPDGIAEQRFLHVQEVGSDTRVMMETRIMSDGRWCLDTALLSGDIRQVLIDRAKLHPANRWAWAALRYDGKTMEAYVNGVKEAEGPVTFGPMKAGQTSLGVRQNLVSWFKGAIREVRFHETALEPEKLQRIK